MRAGQQLGVGIERFSFGFLILSIAPKGMEERPTMDTASIGKYVQAIDPYRNSQNAVQNANPVFAVCALRAQILR